MPFGEKAILYIVEPNHYRRQDTHILPTKAAHVRINFLRYSRSVRVITVAAYRPRATDWPMGSGRNSIGTPHRIKKRWL